MNYLKSTIFYLVAINVIVFSLAFLLKVDVMSRLALYYPQNPSFSIWQILTHFFLHAGIAHILFNMYGLWAFGSPLQKRWGNLRFLTFFFATGLGAALIYTLANYYQFNVIFDELLVLGLSTESIQQVLDTGKVSTNLLDVLSEERLREFISIYHRPAVGASGAIYGVLVAYAVMNPNAKLMLVLFPFPIKAMFFVPIILLGDLFFGITRYSVGNVAHFAHIGGAITGAVIMLWLHFKQEKK